MLIESHPSSFYDTWQSVVAWSDNCASCSPVPSPQSASCLHCQWRKSEMTNGNKKHSVKSQKVGFWTSEWPTTTSQSNMKFLRLWSLTNRSVFSRYFFQKGRIFLCPPMSQTLSFMPWEATLFMLKPWRERWRQRSAIHCLHFNTVPKHMKQLISVWTLYTVTVTYQHKFKACLWCLQGKALCANPQTFS